MPNTNSDDKSAQELLALRVSVVDLCTIVARALSGIEAIRSRLDALESSLDVHPAAKSDSVRRMRLAVDAMTHTLDEAVKS